MEQDELTETDEQILTRARAIIHAHDKRNEVAVEAAKQERAEWEAKGRDHRVSTGFLYAVQRRITVMSGIEKPDYDYLVSNAMNLARIAVAAKQ